MLHSAVGVIREVKLSEKGKGSYIVDFKDTDGDIHSVRSWSIREVKYNEGDSISIRYHSFKIFGKTIIITDRIDDVNQNNDKFAISGASLTTAAICAAIVVIIVHNVRKHLKSEEA